MRCSHRKRQGKVSEKKEKKDSQALESESLAFYLGPHEKDIRVVRRQKTGVRGKHQARMFPWVSMGKVREGRKQFRIGTPKNRQEKHQPNEK